MSNIKIKHSHKQTEDSNDHHNVHEHAHYHNHSPEEYRRLINRMSRIIGHAASVKTMMEEEKDCSDILIQISAVQSALNNLGKLILKNHINECLMDVDHIDDATARKERLDNLNDAIDKFIR